MKNNLLTAIVGAVSMLVAVSCGNKQVQELDQVIVPVESLELDPTHATVDAGDVLALKVTVKPDNATFKTVSWSSSDPKLAEVYNGTVKTIKEGAVTITATASGISAICEITINRVPILVSSITLDKTETTIEIGDTETLVATVNPADADDPTVTWTSSNWAVASVSEGVVTAIGEGTAIITAKAGDKTATCTVTVPHKYIPLENLGMNKTETTIRVGGTEILQLILTPQNADYDNLTWTSSDESVATVSEGVVTALAVGTTTITATASGKSANCVVTVIPIAKPVESVKLNKNATTIEVGGTEILTATIFPLDSDDPTLTWTSSDETVVTVNQNGRIAAVSAGTAVVTATAGGKSDTCTVTVIEADKTNSATIDDLPGEEQYHD